MGIRNTDAAEDDREQRRCSIAGEGEICHRQAANDLEYYR